MSTAVDNVSHPLVRSHSRTSSLLAIPACVALFCIGGIYEAVHQTSLSSISNSDFWVHLRVGLWILQNHAVPRTAIYSQSPDTPWHAASWLYDAGIGFCYQLVGLRTAPALLACFRLLLGVETFLLAGGSRGRFWTAVVLSAAAQYILFELQPGPGYVSVLLFAAVLLLILDHRRTHTVRSLFLLLPLFLLWANLDIDFVAGVLLLLLWLAAAVLESNPYFIRHLKPDELVARDVKTTTVIAVLAIATTGITPYLFRSYSTFFVTATSRANRYLPQHHALSFRKPEDYLLLLLVMWAFLILGMRRSRNPFQLVLLAVCSMLSFHLHTYSWLAVFASLAVLGDVPSKQELHYEKDRDRNFALQLFGSAALASALIVWSVITYLPRSRAALLDKMAATYPVAASNYLRDHHLPQPLFNPLPWGGFLMWYLPGYPVSIDGRIELYNDDSIVQYTRFMNSQISGSTYPPITRARTILLERKSIQAQVLGTLNDYKVVYADDLCTVLLHTVTEP